MNRKMLILTIIVVAIAIPVGVYTFSPLFINRTINESVPSDAVLQYQKFISIDQQHRINAAKSMDEKQKNMIMRAAAQINSTVNEQAWLLGPYPISNHLINSNHLIKPNLPFSVVSGRLFTFQ
jgi:PhoPQ-activated pathogenicity-related protein